MTPTIRSLALFFGLLLFLLGTYGVARTIVNLTVFEKYPTNGVLNVTLTGTYTTYNVRESDCYVTPTPIFDPNGMPIPNSEDQNAKMQQENCLKGQEEDRKNAKVNDIATSLMFIFVGIGLILAVKSNKLSRLLS